MRFKSLFPLVLLLAMGCGGSAGQGQPAKDPLSQASVAIVPLDAAHVAPSIRDLLVDSQLSGERLNRLASVVKAQLLRARFYFDGGNADEGMSATLGALFLIRSAEFRPELFRGSEQTLLDAADYVARLGDEGQALAFYQLADEVLSDSNSKAVVKEHLAALRVWQETSNERGTMQAASAEQRVAIHRALVSTSRKNLQLATTSSLDWLNRAIVEGRRDSPPSTFFEHDERMEARRAVMTSALSVAALYVRDMDATGALNALAIEPLASAANERLVGRLEAAEEGSPEAWADLFGLFESAGDVEHGILTADLSRGASFGAAVSLFRLEPNALRAAVPLATLLVEHGMADVAPLILSDVVNANSDSRELEWTLRLVFGALNRAERTGDLGMARRVFTNAEPLVALSKAPAHASLSPSAADFYYTMGALESRAGEIDRARTYLAEAVALKPSQDALRLLAEIDRQRGDLAAALGSVQGIAELTEKDHDLVGEAQASLLSFELHRDAGSADEAGAALGRALQLVLEARQAARTGTEIAASETLLADVLEHYGAFDAAARAFDRAYDSAQHDLGRLTAALLDSARRALTHWDPVAARTALRRAIDSHISPDDLVYVALWTRLAEQRAGNVDGSVEEALATLESSNAWTQALRDWGRGALSDDQLLARADGVVQRTEADFYVALSAYAQGGKQAPPELDRVARSSAIELIEVRIARDLLSHQRGEAVPPLPSGVAIP
jgi:tetratricopeptide (TPR) repeat protein